MTKAQAMAMNARFLSMDSTIKAYDEAYTFKYHQLHQARQTMVFQDSIIDDLNRRLLVKPKFKKVTKLDLFMAGVFVTYAAGILYFTF
jgi:hypothetical protein